MIIVADYKLEFILRGQLVVKGHESLLGVEGIAYKKGEMRRLSGQLLQIGGIRSEIRSILAESVRFEGDQTLLVIPYELDFLDITCEYGRLHIFQFHFLGGDAAVVEEHPYKSSQKQKIQPG